MDAKLIFIKILFGGNHELEFNLSGLQWIVLKQSFKGGGDDDEEEEEVRGEGVSKVITFYLSKWMRA